MAGALGLYTQRLQREGAAQWVRVAEWRRQNRLNNAVAAQVYDPP